MTEMQGASPFESAHKLGSQLFAETAQKLTDANNDSEALQAMVPFRSHISSLPEFTNPEFKEENELRVAKLCRDAALGPLTLNAAVKTLQMLNSGIPLVTNQDPIVDDSIENSWTREIKFRDDDLSFLRILFDMTDKYFMAAIGDMQERQPYIVKIWEKCGKDVYSSAKTLCDNITSKTTRGEELTKRDKSLLKYNGPIPKSALEQARATNGTATLLTAAVLLMEQRNSNNTLSGTELSQRLLDQIQRATGLVGGKRNIVTDILTATGDFHDPNHLADMLTTEGMYRMGPFTKRYFAVSPGDCAAYPLLSPSLNSADRDNELSLIGWHRARTNKGVSEVNFPQDAIRPAEAHFAAGAQLCSELWGIDKPFLPSF